MGHIVIKPERDRDLYVVWSTIVDAPLAWGDRAEVHDYLTRDQPGHGLAGPAARLDRADLNGTSALGDFSFFGRWDDEGLGYEQRGYLPRQHLARACELLGEDREAEVWDLLKPFEDVGEVRRG